MLGLLTPPRHLLDLLLLPIDGRALNVNPSELTAASRTTAKKLAALAGNAAAKWERIVCVVQLRLGQPRAADGLP